MVDLAKVGFQADTSPLKQAADDLDAFKQRAQGVGDSLDKVNESAAKSADALNKAGTDIQNAGKSVEAAGTSAKTAGDQIDGLSASANKASDALSKTATTAEAAGKQIDATASSVKDVSDKLDKTSEAAGKASDAAKATGDNLSTAGRAANDAAGSMSKTASSANEVAAALVEAAAQSGKYQGATAQIEQIVSKTGVSYAQAAQALKAATDAQKAVSTATSIASTEAARSTSIWGALANALGLSSSSMAINTTAARELGKSHKEASEFGTQFRETLHTVTPALNTVGLGMSSLTQFSGAARLGIAGLSVAIGTELVVSLAKAGDETITLRQRLQGLVGMRLGTQLAGDVKEMSHDLAVAPAPLEQMYETLLKMQQLHGPTNMLPPGMKVEFEEARLKIDDVKTAVQTMFEQLRTGGATTEEATKGISDFFANIAKNGTLTGDALRKLQDVAPAAAQQLTDAMTGGTKNAQEFAAQLDKTPVKFDAVVKAAKTMADRTQDAFQDMMDSPTKFSDALDKVKAGITDLWDKLAEPNKDGSPAAITTIVSNLGDAIDRIDVTPLDRALGKIAEWQKTALDASKGNYEFGKSVDNDIVANIVKLGQTLETSVSWWYDYWTTPIANALASSLTHIGSWVVDAWNKISNFVAQVASAAKSIASSIASMFSSGESAAAAAQSANTGGASGGWSGPNGSSSGSSSSSGATGSWDTGGGQSAGFLTPIGDAGTIDLGDLGGGSGMITDNLPAFAIGGQFTVDGSGGTDSQLVQFMATPGEVVTITPPGGGAPPDPSMSPIAAAVTSGLTPIAANDNSSPTGALSDSLASQTDSITSKFAQNIAGQTDGITKKLDETTGLITAAIAAQTGALENFWTDLQAKIQADALSASATSSSATGASGVTPAAAAPGALGTPAEMFAQSPLSSRYTLPYYLNGGGAISGVSGISNGTGATGNALGSWLNPNPNGAPTYSRSSGGVTRAPAPSSSGASSSPLSSAYDSTGSMTDLSQGGSMLPPGYGGGSSGMPITDSSGSVTDYSGLSYDYGGGDAIDFGGDSYYAGAYATGGSFTVPGGGGIDTTLVMMRATAGEQVSVSQPGAIAGGGGGNLPPIIMNVYAKDADSFLKSKDQIAAEFARAVAEAQKAA